MPTTGWAREHRTRRVDTAEIRRAVLQTIASIAPETDLQLIRPDQPLRRQVDLDSMDWLNFLVRLHKRFEVDIPESQYAALRTIDDLTGYITAHQ